METTITNKQLEILILLYRFRFLNRIQIQTLLNHKDAKRINTWLKDLTDKSITGRHYSKRINENNKPAIYYLMTKSKAFLIKQNRVDSKLLLKRIYREKTRSQKLVKHSVLLANFYLDLLKTVTDEKLYFFTKTDLAPFDYLAYKRPDAYIAREGKTTKRYFLEIIDEGTPRFMIRYKIRQYIEYYESNIWPKNTGHPFPALLFLCPNEMIKKFIQKYINQLMEEEALDGIDFYLSAADKIAWVKVGEETDTTPEE